MVIFCLQIYNLLLGKVQLCLTFYILLDYKDLQRNSPLQSLQYKLQSLKCKLQVLQCRLQSLQLNFLLGPIPLIIRTEKKNPRHQRWSRIHHFSIFSVSIHARRRRSRHEVDRVAAKAECQWWRWPRNHQGHRQSTGSCQLA